jgi:hypothetical protein
LILIKPHIDQMCNVEGVETNTPPKTNTYKRLLVANTLLRWITPHGVGVPKPTKVTVSGSISGVAL